MKKYTDYRIENDYGPYQVWKYDPETEAETRFGGQHATLDEALDSIIGDEAAAHGARVTFSTGNSHWEAFEA